MNWLAREVAESSTSPRVPTIMVSSILTPMVIRLCRAMGRASVSTLP